VADALLDERRELTEVDCNLHANFHNPDMSAHGTSVWPTGPADEVGECLRCRGHARVVVRSHQVKPQSARDSQAQAHQRRVAGPAGRVHLGQPSIHSAGRHADYRLFALHAAGPGSVGTALV
jgi:hypothetical protein